MSLFASLEDAVVGQLVFPLTNWLYNRNGVLRTYRSLMASERYSPQQLAEIQLARLKRVLQQAETWCPYYRRKLHDAGITAADLRSLQDLASVPPLSRQELIDHRLELVDERHRESVRIADESGRPSGAPISLARFKPHRIVRNTSSGSTGAPTVFYEDGATSAQSWAHELRLRKWFGIAPGARESRMARLATEYNADNATVRLRKALWHQHLLPGTNLSEPDYQYCVSQINAFRPRVIWGYPSAVAGLAAFVAEHHTPTLQHRPELAITWAGPMYDHEREVIEAALSPRVTNIYGSREVGHIAALCPGGSLHVNQEFLYVEHEDSGDGSPGEIMVTTLWPSVMPFIRFRMGDVGIVDSSGCACGRSLQVIRQFLGRTGEIFITKDGRMISPNFWYRVFMDEERGKAVDRFQVVYSGRDSVRVRIVRNSRFTAGTEADLKAYLHRNFHPEIRVEFDYVDDIQSGRTGKYQMVVRE